MRVSYAWPSAHHNFVTELRKPWHTVRRWQWEQSDCLDPSPSSCCSHPTTGIQVGPRIPREHMGKEERGSSSLAPCSLSAVLVEVCSAALETGASLISVLARMRFAVHFPALSAGSCLCSACDPGTILYFSTVLLLKIWSEEWLKGFSTKNSWLLTIGLQHRNGRAFKTRMLIQVCIGECCLHFWQPWGGV